jgi:integrase/recombinase XerD
MNELTIPTEPALITGGMIREVIIKMTDSGLSPVTVNHRVRSLKQFYAYLVKEAIVTENPTERLEKQKEKRSIIETFTEVQIQVLLAMPDKTTFVGFRDYIMMLLLLDTGIRLSELVHIKLQDMNIANSEIIITQGKGGKARRVFLSEKTESVLKKYLRVRGDIPGNPYLFINSEDKPIKNRNVQERITVYGQKAKLEGVRVSPHTFRHTFAKMYITRGGDPFSLQSLLGHSTLEMVRHYVNLWGTDLQKMHRQFSPVEKLFTD